MVQGRRPQDETSWSDAACTPRWLAELIGHVDFDPCSNERSWIQAAWSFMLDKGIDGLKMPWRGRGFENWPYSEPMPWAEKSIYEMEIGNCTDLIVLCKLDPSTEWWQVITQPVLGALDRWDFDKRIQFDEHPQAVIERKQRREEALIERERLKQEALARGEKKPKLKPLPPKKSSNNFASVILHHRAPDAPVLGLWDHATLWRKVEREAFRGAA